MIIYLMGLHFIADFLLQSREMGKKKSTEVVWLIRHLFIQTAVFYAGLLPLMLLGYVTPVMFLLLPLGNTIVHGIIDWNIWNLYKYSVFIRLKPILVETELGPMEMTNDGSDWKYWEDHLFYTTIGCDQMLHGATLAALLMVL
jgi:hypothetical protein